MVDPKAVAAAVVGALLSIVGGVGALAMIVGALAGAWEWTTVAWLLVLAFVAGAGLLTYGVAALAGDLRDAVADGNLSTLTDEVDAARLRHLLD